MWVLALAWSPFLLLILLFSCYSCVLSGGEVTVVVFVVAVFFFFIFLVLPFLANIRYLSSVECDCNTSIHCIAYVYAYVGTYTNTHALKWCEKLICQYCHTCASVLFISSVCVFLLRPRLPPSACSPPIQSPKSFSVETDALFSVSCCYLCSYFILYFIDWAAEQYSCCLMRHALLCCCDPIFSQLDFVSIYPKMRCTQIIY